MSSVQNSSSSSVSRASTKTAIVPGMMGVYNQLLGLNEQNYSNILSGYQQGQQALEQHLQSVYSGYGDIESKVMNMLGVSGGGWGVATPAANAIRQGATKAQGQTQQNMINAGLGNTTVLSNLTNQNSLQTNQAYGELGSKLADYAAGYAERIGLARQQAMLSGAGMQAQLTGSYLGDLSSYKFANTAGDLTGTFSNSYSSSQSQGSGMSVDPISAAGSAPRRSGGMSQGPAQPSYQDAYAQKPMGDIEAWSYQAQNPNSYQGGGNQLNLSGGYVVDPSGWAGMDPERSSSPYRPYGPGTSIA